MFHRVFARVALAGLLGALLGACTIISKTPLLETAEIVSPLPAKLYLFPYDPDTLKLTHDPATLTLEGDHYAADKGFSLRFAGPPDAEGRYVVEVADKTETDSSGYMYGLARFDDTLLSTDLVLPQDAKEVMARHPELGLTATDRGLEVKTRAELAAVLDLARTGELKLVGFAYYMTTDPKAEPPASVISDETGFHFPQ